MLSSEWGTFWNLKAVIETMENYAAYFLSMQTIEIVLKVNECMVSINGFEKNGFEIKGISFQTTT